jgi:hypothetical protein
MTTELSAPPDPFARLPMEFRLNPFTKAAAASPLDIKLQKMDLVRAARDQGLDVEHFVDPRTCEEVFIVNSPTPRPA